jgi:DNA helicase-2/ATP-dependent DNA helicase PcrA
MEAERVDAKRWPPQALMAVIQRWKDRGLPPARVTPQEASDFAAGRASALYSVYQARLRSLNAVDFGDLLLHVTELLRDQPDVLARYQRSFRYILVDEYQDTNLVQYLWLRLLTQGHRNICCVGDVIIATSCMTARRHRHSANLARSRRAHPRVWRAVAGMKVVDSST